MVRLAAQTRVWCDRGRPKLPRSRRGIFFAGGRRDRSSQTVMNIRTRNATENAKSEAIDATTGSFSSLLWLHAPLGSWGGAIVDAT